MTRSESAIDPQVLLAQLDEAEALVQMLRQRTVQLNLEVRSRDEVIADLRRRLNELQAVDTSGEVGTDG